MKKRNIWFYGALLITLITATLLAIGSPLLTLPLDSNASIPLGTFITWFGFIALPLCIYWGSKAFRKPTTALDRFFSIAIKTTLVLAILWLPISYLLSGNLSFSFTEKESFQGGQLAMKWFWRLSYSTIIGPVLILITFWIKLLFRSVKFR